MYTFASSGLPLTHISSCAPLLVVKISGFFKKASIALHKTIYPEVSASSLLMVNFVGGMQNKKDASFGYNNCHIIKSPSVLYSAISLKSHLCPAAVLSTANC